MQSGLILLSVAVALSGKQEPIAARMPIQLAAGRKQSGGKNQTALGKETVKIVWLPGSLQAVSKPLYAWAMDMAIERPRPVPGTGAFAALCAFSPR